MPPPADTGPSFRVRLHAYSGTASSTANSADGSTGRHPGAVGEVEAGTVGPGVGAALLGDAVVGESVVGVLVGERVVGESVVGATVGAGVGGAVIPQICHPAPVNCAVENQVNVSPAMRVEPDGE